MARMSLDTCMDIFDWFDDNTFEYINHILLCKVDGEERVKRALPELRKHARWLLKLHRGTEAAYPEELLNQPPEPKVGPRIASGTGRNHTAGCGAGRGSREQTFCHSFQIKYTGGKTHERTLPDRQRDARNHPLYEQRGSLHGLDVNFHRNEGISVKEKVDPVLHLLHQVYKIEGKDNEAVSIFAAFIT